MPVQWFSVKTLEEQLEEEIAREVDELVLTKSENNSIHPINNNNNNNNNNDDDLSVTDEIDEELELEILAELEGGNNMIDHSISCNVDDSVKEANS
ncbi:unnamed protein product [Schistosoma margrebowiei]|uniref:Uncharacterized protein n=1 Tax=Schistosoma margrebowiei TaxID=48269 RepID=A0A183MCS8_9TREM|nr:unnamed protein product [Schistosoma margrebowiei]